MGVDAISNSIVVQLSCYHSVLGFRTNHILEVPDDASLQVYLA